MRRVLVDSADEDIPVDVEGESVIVSNCDVTQWSASRVLVIDEVSKDGGCWSYLRCSCYRHISTPSHRLMDISSLELSNV